MPRGLQARIERLEDTLTPDTLIVQIRTFPLEEELTGFELTGTHRGSGHVFARDPGEAEETFCSRVDAEVRRWGGVVVLKELRRRPPS